MHHDILNQRRHVRTSPVLAVCPRQDSNLRHRLRRAVLYPLSYGGAKPGKPSSGVRPDQSAGAGSGAPPSLRNVCSIRTISSLWMVIITRAKWRTYGCFACSVA
jgi:hypothetical protein